MRPVRGVNRLDEGYSLIELLIVIAIIGILATIAVISMLNYRTTILANTALREVAQEMRVARSKAVRDNKPYLFRIWRNPGDTYHTHYGFCPKGELGEGGGTDGYYECAGFLTARTLPSGIVFGHPWTKVGVNLTLPADYVSITHGTGPVSVRKNNGVGYGLTTKDLYAWAYLPNGTASHEVVAFLDSYNEISSIDGGVAYARALTVSRMSGMVRAWRWSGSWN